jgi:ArsR family transcriptional regulator, arsenate/arsenite/antimonite-responsive transcriptional repressor
MKQEIIALEERHKGDRCCASDVRGHYAPEERAALTADLQLLGNEVRLQILELLTRNEGQVCVCDLESALPVKQSTVSHHLKLLREAGVIDYERRGLWAYYFVNQEALTALRLRISQQLALLQ